MYVPASTAALVMAGSPLWPVIGVGPLADRVQAVGRAVPPLTCLVRVRWAAAGGMNVLVIEQLAVSPAARTRLLPVRLPPVHDQAQAL